MRGIWFAAMAFGILFVLLSQSGNAAVAPPLVRCAFAAFQCENSTLCPDALARCIDDCDALNGKDVMSGEDINAENCQNGKALACYYCLNGNGSSIQSTPYYAKLENEWRSGMNESYQKLAIYLVISFVSIIATYLLLKYVISHKSLKKYLPLAAILLITLIILEIIIFLSLFIALFMQPIGAG